MKIRFGAILVALTIFMSGCASTPQQPVYLSHDAIGSQSGSIGVAMTKLPKLDTHIPGANCLLCLAAASLANSTLTSHAQTLSYEDLPQQKVEVANLLRKKGANAVVIEDSLDVNALPDFGTKGANIALKDFSSLQQKYKIDKLLVIDITALGFIRTYSTYFPTSDPKALLRGAGYLVNLKNNTYDWYQPVDVIKSADQNWDEPPKFPGLTNAYYQALEIGKDDFLKPLAGDAVTAITKPVASTSVSSPVATNSAPAQSTVQ